MNVRNYSFRLSDEERMEIVRQYVTGNRPARFIVEDYGICLRTLRRWTQEYKKNCGIKKNIVPLHSKSKPSPKLMDNSTPQEEIIALKAELEKERKERLFAENKVIALNRMIDIAEQQGILIRKNSGAKQ